jgi:hypothetical protein
VKELMIFETLEAIPFTIVWKRFADEEETLVFIIFALEVMPFTFEFIVFPIEERVFDIGIEEVDIETTAFVRFRFPVMIVLPERLVLAEFRDTVFVVEALMLVAKRFVKYPVTVLNKFENIFVAVAFVIEALVEKRFVDEALLKLELEA